MQSRHWEGSPVESWMSSGLNFDLHYAQSAYVLPRVMTDGIDTLIPNLVPLTPIMLDTTS